MSAFIFNNQGNAKAVHRAEVPAGIKNKAALLDALSIALRFPDYFGENWDALWECICDLSWLPPGDVILIHKDLPLSQERNSLFTYLAILNDAIENWNITGSNMIFASPEKWDATGEHKLLVKRKLLVTFPSSTEGIVRGLLPDAGEGNGGNRIASE